MSAPEEYHDLREEILQILEHPRSSSDERDEIETESNAVTLTVPSCPSCGTILPEDTTAGFSGECPSCHRVSNPEEVFH